MMFKSWVGLALRHFGGAALTACLFAVIDAFPDEAPTSLHGRLLFWFSIIAPCWLSIALMVDLLQERYRIERLVDRLIIGVLCSVTLAVPCSFLAVATWRGFRTSDVSFFQMFTYVAIFSVIMSIMTMILSGVTGYRQHQETKRSARDPVPPSGGAMLNDRLPHHVRGEILHIHAQDHYVRISTDRGSHLVLLRFADALQEVSGLDGRRVHRSHWVSRSAVEELQLHGVKRQIKLVTGDMIPVSRSEVKAARNWMTERVITGAAQPK